MLKVGGKSCKKVTLSLTCKTTVTSKSEKNIAVVSRKVVKQIEILLARSNRHTAPSLGIEVEQK